MSATAQDAYADMLRTEIAPKLRALGFKGSGNSYVLPDADRWLVVAFQKNRYSSAEFISFTVNIAAADKRVWAAAHAAERWVPARPSATVVYPWTESNRLGALAYGYDRWWAVEPGVASVPVAAEVVEAIERYGLPWLAGSNPPRDIRQR